MQAVKVACKLCAVFIKNNASARVELEAFYCAAEKNGSAFIYSLF
jgi:hypothetical protein